MITYGVTDCDPAIARVPLAAVLEATLSGPICDTIVAIPHIARYSLREVSTHPKWCGTPLGTCFHTGTPVRYPILQRIAR